MRRLLLLVPLLAGLLGALPVSAADAPPGTLTAQPLGEQVALADGRDGSLLVGTRTSVIRVGTGGVSVVADGVGPVRHLAVSPAGDVVYVASVVGELGDRWIVRAIRDGQVTTAVNAGAAMCEPWGSGCGDGGPATAAGLSEVRDLATGPDGSLYLADAHRVRRVAPDGTIDTVAGAGEPCIGTRITEVDPCGDGGAALAAGLSIEGGVAVAADGRIAVLDQDRIRMIGTDGIIRTVAGDGVRCLPPDPCGDGGPAAEARFGMAITATFLPTGELLVGERMGARVRRLTAAGTVETVAGTYRQCGQASRCPGEGGPAQRAALDPIIDMALAGPDLFLDVVAFQRRLAVVHDVASVAPEPKQRYRFVASDGGVFNFGWAPFHGSTGSTRLNQPIVGGVATGAGGYWLVARDGGIFSFGDAPFLGSSVGKLTAPVTAMAVTTTGKGYWILESNGRALAYGDADLISQAISGSDAVGIAADPDGGGRWVVFEDGKVDARGATDHGSVTGPHQPVVGMAVAPGGYWVAASDGAVYAFGAAPHLGSMAGKRLNRPIVDIVATPTGRGYWLVASDGGVFSFGDARFHGSTGGLRLNAPIVGAMAG